MLEAAGLSRRYGWRWALREVSMTIPWGSSLALLGANGAGKSTLLKMLAGLLRPTEGQVRLDGAPITARDRGRIGMLGHDPLLYPSLTLQENLEFSAKLFGMARARRGERIREVAEWLGLSSRLDDPIRSLSQGLRQRAALSRALLHGPDILFLDEPFAGLDVRAADRLERLVGEYTAEGRGRILVFTTHEPGRARAIAREAVLLAEGRVALRVPAAEVASQAFRAALHGPPPGEGGP
ncbi:MAG: ABC transporter ATP-binding protein [Nitrospinota bacterium]